MDGAGLAELFRTTVSSGPLLAALPVALIAGMVSVSITSILIAGYMVNLLVF